MLHADKMSIYNSPDFSELSLKIRIRHAGNCFKADPEYGKGSDSLRGYDNTHNYHHKHYFGEISEVDDFTNYQDLIDRFEKEIKEFIK